MPVIRTVVKLGPRRWLQVAYLLTLSIFVEISLHLRPLPRLAASLGVPLALDGAAAPPGWTSTLGLTRTEDELLDIAWRILRRRPFNPTCLRRALIGGHVLRRRRPRLRIGVRKIAGEVAAHAWVEVDGVSLDPDAGLGYGVLDLPPRPGGA